jgi:Sulfotransferase family
MSSGAAATGPGARLDAEELIRVSRSATGLTRFGNPDPQESLSRLVRALNEEAQLTAAGVAAKRASLIRVLGNRLQLEDQFAREPRIAAEHIASPIVILGLPRSGTTKLHRMIGADPMMQKLPLWRLLYPVQAPTPGPESDVERRIAATEAYVETIRKRSPTLYAGHPMLAREPDEEYFGMELSFLAHLNTSSFHTPGYEAWLDAQDFNPWYFWLRRLLQYVQFSEHAGERPWVLKAPHHLGYLPLLRGYFPDVTVVHCHRDPLVAVASFCALLHASRVTTSDRVDPADIGRYVLRAYSRRLSAYLRDRPSLERSNGFVDVSYREILRDAPTVIRRSYAAAGLELDERRLQAMRDWDAANAQHKHGRHQYSLGDFGLSKAEVGAVFEAYSTRFADYLC